MLRVALFPADTDACGRYRMFMPAQAAAASEDVKIGFGALRPDEHGRITGMPADVDVAVFQRPAHRLVAETIPHFQAKGIAIVVDLDDDLAALDPRHAGFPHLHPSNPKVNWHNIKRACQLADIVTVSTPALAARYGARRARVLPNFVPASLLDVEVERDGRTVGWAGSTFTHIDDLTVTGGGIAQALNDTGARFLLVGRDPDEAREQLGLAENPDTVGYVPFDQYPEQVARFDVGLAPLRDTLFNRSKSGLKPLEMAALGVPCVVSPLPDYLRLADEGIGLVAERPKDWRRQVGRLLEDEAYADDVAARAEDAVRERHLMERNAWRWAEAWQEAASARRADRVAA